MSGAKKPIDRKILLSSGSPRRAYLLKQADIDFRHEWNSCEEKIKSDLKPAEIAIDIAEQKYLGSKSLRRAGEIILTADTIVVFQNEIMGKPSCRNEAIQTLRKLAGNPHTVITGVILADEEHCTKFSSETQVSFYEMSDTEIEYYVDQYQPMDKAGSYGIQEWIGWSMIKSISGSYSNIIGLPVAQVYQKLKNW